MRHFFLFSSIAVLLFAYILDDQLHFLYFNPAIKLHEPRIYRRPCPSVSFVHDLDKKIFGECIVYSCFLMIRCMKYCFGLKRLLLLGLYHLRSDMEVIAAEIAETSNDKESILRSFA